MLVVMDVSRILNDAKEDRNGISRQLRLSKTRKCSKVERLSRLRRDLQCGATRSTFMVGEFHAVDICLCDAGELSDDLGDFGGCTISRPELVQDSAEWMDTLRELTHFHSSSGMCHQDDRGSTNDHHSVGEAHPQSDSTDRPS